MVEGIREVCGTLIQFCDDLLDVLEVVYHTGYSYAHRPELADQLFPFLPGEVALSGGYDKKRLKVGSAFW